MTDNYAMKNKDSEIFVCQHYIVLGGGIRVGYARSMLRKVSLTKCVCEECHKEFPIKTYRIMEKFMRNFPAHSGCTEIIPYKMRISKEVPPVKYYCVGDVIRYVDDEEA